MDTYSVEVSAKEHTKTQTMEATDGPLMGQHGVDGWSSMQDSVTSMHTS